MEPGDNIRRLLRRPGAVDAQPQSAYDHVSKQRLDDLVDQVDALQRQVWGLYGALATAVIIQIIVGLLK